jgi:CBS domain containing-hemolysin-like protein
MLTMSDSDPSFFKKISSRLKQKWKSFRRVETDSKLRETLEELIEDAEVGESSIASDERMLLGNVLDLRDLTAQDVMIPRVDIIAIPQTISATDLISTMIRSRHSRLPVYRNTLDDVIGAVDIQDVLAWLASKKPLNIKSLITNVLFISPTMRTLDLLFQMRETGTKMALVVDEYGGIDGMVTFSDLIEEIIGDIQDAQDSTPSPQVIERADGSLVIDARVLLEELQEERNLNLVIPELEDEVDTIGGLVIALAGRLPSRGELIQHPKGYEIEIMDADPRRVKRVCLHKK